MNSSVGRAEVQIVRFSRHPSGQTSRETGTQSVESGFGRMVALPGEAAPGGKPAWMGEPRRSTGVLP